MRAFKAKWCASIVGLVLMFAAFSTAMGTVVRHLNWDQMVYAADLIVLGEAVGNRTHWNEDKTKIYTTTEFKVSSAVMGDAGDTVFIRQLGGSKDGLSSAMPGAPEFKQGEDLLLFLENRPDGAFVLVGLNQGKCRIGADTATGQIVIAKSRGGKAIHLVKLGGDEPVDENTILYEELLMLIDQKLEN